jgi:regulatory protein
MRIPRRELATDADLYAAALRALMRRAHSVHEMRVYLERRSDNVEAVRKALDRLKQEKLLDDARYARQFARVRTETRRQGAFRINQDLRARGVPQQHIDAALEERGGEINEAEILRTRIAHRLKILRGPLDQRRLASLYRSLLRAGFAPDTIRRELGARARLLADELPDSPPDET